MSDAPEEGFISHLIELRSRLIRASVAVLVVFVCLAPFSSQIYDILAAPMVRSLPANAHMIATGVVTSFIVPIKVTVLAAFLLALPYVLYQAWAFIAPGLYTHEKRLAAPLVIVSTLLFVLGMAFCYFFVFGTVFRVIAQVAPKSIVQSPDIEQYLSFVMTLFIAFGLTFEVPVVVVVLVRIGAVSIAKLKEIRPYAIVGAFIVAAIVAPPDVPSMLLLAIPMCLLYEVGILAARLVTPRNLNGPATQAPD